jgi:hypothetical protein
MEQSMDPPRPAPRAPLATRMFSDRHTAGRLVVQALLHRGTNATRELIRRSFMYRELVTSSEHPTEGRALIAIWRAGFAYHS